MLNAVFFSPLRGRTNFCSTSTHPFPILFPPTSQLWLYLFVVYLLSISALSHVQFRKIAIYETIHVSAPFQTPSPREFSFKRRNFHGTRLNRPRLLQMLSLHRHSGLMDADEKCPLETNRFGSAFSAEAYHRNRVNPRDDDFSSGCHHWSSHYSASLMRLNRETSGSAASNIPLIQPGHRNPTPAKTWWTSLLYGQGNAGRCRSSVGYALKSHGNAGKDERTPWQIWHRLVEVGLAKRKIWGWKEWHGLWWLLKPEFWVKECARFTLTVIHKDVKSSAFTNRSNEAGTSKWIIEQNAMKEHWSYHQ